MTTKRGERVFEIRKFKKKKGCQYSEVLLDLRARE